MLFPLKQLLILAWQCAAVNLIGESFLTLTLGSLEVICKLLMTEGSSVIAIETIDNISMAVCCSEPN